MVFRQHSMQVRDIRIRLITTPFLEGIINTRTVWHLITKNTAEHETVGAIIRQHALTLLTVTIFGPTSRICRTTQRTR